MLTFLKSLFELNRSEKSVSYVPKHIHLGGRLIYTHIICI